MKHASFRWLLHRPICNPLVLPVYGVDPNNLELVACEMGMRNSVIGIETWGIREGEQKRRSSSSEEMIFFFRRRRDQKLDWSVHVSKKAPRMLPPTIILSNIMPNSWKAWMDMNHAYQLVQAESASCRGRASECNPWASDPHLASTAPSSGLCSRRSREFSPCLLADRWMLYLPTLTRDKNLHPTALSWFTTLHNHRLRNSSSPTHKH